MMNYKFLSAEERKKIVEEFLREQEKDHYCHAINRDRYREMLKTLPRGPFHEKITKLLSDTESRLAEVEAIITATVKANL